MDGLSRYNPIWDQTRHARAAARGYVLATDDLLLATDFECGNGRNVRQSGPASLEIDLEPEPGEHRYSGLSYYYCFGVANRGAAPRRIKIALHSHMGEPTKGIGACTIHAVTKRGEIWGQVPGRRMRRANGGATLELTLDLPSSDDPDPVVFASDFHWYPNSEVARWVESLRSEPRVRVFVAGKSEAGRDLYRLDLGRDAGEAPAVVMSQTPQPSEGTASWSCRRIVEFLLSGSAVAEDILKRFRIVVLPATNPDGTVEGLGVSHPSGRFPFFEGKKTADEEPDALPEMKILWGILKQEKPWLFIDWHSNHLGSRPGHMLLRYDPALMESADVRRIWEDIDSRLESLPDTYDGGHTNWNEGCFQDTIGFMAATRLQTVSYMIKHHDKFPLENCTDHAVRCFQEALDAGRKLT